MPPFRLLHVAGLDLDAALPARPWYSQELANLCERAPLAVAEQIAAAAIDHGVDAVLLIPAARPDGLPDVLSLAARESWQDLIDSLGEQGIAVVIAAHGDGPPWPGLAKPDTRQQPGVGVSVLRPGDQIPLYDRQRRLCAEFRGPEALCDQKKDSFEKPLVIGVAPGRSVADADPHLTTGCDYLALGTGPRETWRSSGSTAHCPGPPQGRSWRETGRHGVSLLTTDGNGRLDVQFISTASVRFESLDVRADSNAQIDDVALLAMESLDSRKAEASERGWLVSWTIQTAGRLPAHLDTESGRRELLSLLPEEHDGRLVCHQITTAPVAEHDQESPFAKAFQKALQEARGRLDSREGRASLTGISTRTSGGRRIADLLAACDEPEVLKLAERHGERLAEEAARDSECM